MKLLVSPILAQLVPGTYCPLVVRLPEHFKDPKQFPGDNTEKTTQSVVITKHIFLPISDIGFLPPIALEEGSAKIVP